MTHVTALPARAFGLAALVAGGLGFAGSAGAAPLAVAPLAGDAMVQTVAGGCGPGFHPNPWGVCRPNWGPRPYYGPRPYWGGPRPYWRRPVVYGPRPYYRPYGFYGPRW
ncbi:GCG_CRPN prefix-to-repeats domain-containing protein [Methylobacterium symbioticum]|uniref:Uncharacterized protein n=1 Tax=Methylobacterium symbioticum TaxID=2584084 RepID=A0A509EEI9_9HYPH|nr:hypothetical protein [Methylobacterium symbioticum]VUD72528.1 hypothetical protein MET9862_03128 [Methylobacterium symbioticum]